MLSIKHLLKIWLQLVDDFKRINSFLSLHFFIIQIFKNDHQGTTYINPLATSGSFLTQKKNPISVETNGNFIE